MEGWRTSPAVSDDPGAPARAISALPLDSDNRLGNGSNRFGALHSFPLRRRRSRGAVAFRLRRSRIVSAGLHPSGDFARGCRVTAASAAITPTGGPGESSRAWLPHSLRARVEVSPFVTLGWRRRSRGYNENHLSNAWPGLWSPVAAAHTCIANKGLTDLRPVQQYDHNVALARIRLLKQKTYTPSQIRLTQCNVSLECFGEGFRPLVPSH